jgi:hypothetical protein
MLTAIVLSDLLSRMSAVNADLRTYTATLHADIRMSTFPFLATEITGTIYRKEPSEEKLVITNGLPGIAQQFGRLYPQIVAPSLWVQRFHVREMSDDGTVSHLRLVPVIRGNVESIDATVNDRTALVAALRWNYRNGGWARMAQTYQTIGDDELAVTQQGHIQEPGYVADIDATVTDYHLNVPIADDVFER